MLSFLPALKPYETHHFSVQAPHAVYVEECGTPDGIPILILPDGLGAGCSSFHKRLFDPDVYRMILVDPRGCGHSTPHAELKENNTAAILNDLELIRQELGIQKWLVFGGSWGAALALLYAEQHPDRVLGVLVHSVFLARPKDIDWLFKSGANQIFPDFWADFIRNIPESERDNLLDAYHERLSGDDEIARMAAARGWSQWEGQCATLHPDAKHMERFHDPFQATSIANISCYYLQHGCFLEPNQILRDAHNIAHLPCFIIQGRYDILCPPEGAWSLHQALPDAEFYLIREAGHALTEPGLVDGIIQAGRKMAALFNYQKPPAC